MMTPSQIEALRAPFPPEKVSWRVGSTTADKSRGMALAYIDARDVMERLDDVCGIGGWQNRYPHATGKTVCEIGIYFAGDQWIWKADGAGDTDVEAEKGALSDAFKRAAVRWGIGRYLYDLPSPWVALKQVGRSFAIADDEHARLRALLTKEAGKVAPSPEPPPTAPQPTEAERLIAKLKSFEQATDLYNWLSDTRVIDALSRLSDEDTMRFNSAKATQKMNLGA